MRLLALLLASVAAYAQSFPTSIYTPLVAKDNISTTLSSAMLAGDNVAVVTSSTGWLPNMVAYICDSSVAAAKCASTFEVMLVTAVNGNILTVTRGYGGTSAIAHARGRTISNSIAAVYNTTLSNEVHAIETALGAGMTNVPRITAYDAASYNFAAQTPGGSLIIGSNTITMTPVPLGVNGTDTQHYLYISGGTGTAEACLINGGSGTAGQASGSITILCANTHSGAWTVQSASAGIIEAKVALNGVGTIILPNASMSIYGTMVIPTTINLIGQGTSIVGGHPASILNWYGGAHPAMIVASGSTDSLSGQYGVGVHRDYALYSPNSTGDGIWIGGDPSNALTPSTWQGDYTNFEYIRVINFTNTLVYQFANFVTFTNSVFSGLTRALLVPSTASGLQYTNFISCVLTVPSGYAVQMDASSFGSGQIIFSGGQVSGTITGQSLHWQSFGTHYEPNDTGSAIVYVNGYSSVFEAYGGLMGTHNVASGAGYQMFFAAGGGLTWVRLSGISVSDTTSNIAKWVWFQSAGNLQIDGTVYFPASVITQLYSVAGGGSPSGIIVSQPLMAAQTIVAGATITWSTGNVNFPDAGTANITGATVGGGITAVAGLLTGQKGTIITASAQTFTAGATVGNTLTTTAGLPYTYFFDGTKIYIK